MGNVVKNPEIENLLRQKSKLKISLSKNVSEEKKSQLKIKLTQTEEQLSNVTSSRNEKIVEEHVKSLDANGGKFSQTGMWRLKNKLWPKPKDPPMAKYDKKGNLITSSRALKELYINHYVQRLEHREIRSEYRENYEKKVQLWQLRSENLKVKVTNDWSIKQ